MQVKVIMSKKEGRIAIISAIVLLVIAYFVNRAYIYLLQAEVENDVYTKLLLKFGFVWPLSFKREIDLNPKSKTEAKVKFYNYKIVATPLVDKTTQKVTGEYLIEIFRGKNTKPYKSLTIHTDDYYVKYKKTPLGRL